MHIDFVYSSAMLLLLIKTGSPSGVPGTGIALEWYPRYWHGPGMVLQVLEWPWRDIGMVFEWYFNKLNI